MALPRGMCAAAIIGCTSSSSLDGGPATVDPPADRDAAILPDADARAPADTGAAPSPPPTLAVPTGDTAAPAGPPTFPGRFEDVSAPAYATLGAIVLRDAQDHPILQPALPADLDGDGQPEVLISRLDLPTVDAPQAVAVLARDDAGTWVFDLAATEALLAQGVSRVVGAVDLDGDGLLDLIQTDARDGDQLVLRGQGGGRWTRADVTLDPGHGSAFEALALADVDHDGWLDVLLGHSTCFDRDRSALTVLHRTGPATWTERGDLFEASAWATGRLVGALPMGDGQTFYMAGGVACRGLPTHPFFYRRDGHTADLLPTFAPHDPAPRSAAFRQTPAYAGAAVTLLNPMGAAVADFDANGRFDLLVAVAPAAQLFLEDDSADVWIDRSPDFALDFPVLPGTTEREAWGSAPIDLDRDGRVDLVIAQSDDAVARDLPRHTRVSYPRLFWNDGGRFTMLPALGLDAALGNWQTVVPDDVDGDGDLDLVVGGFDFLPRLYRNDLGAPGHGLHVRLVGTTSNHLGVGAQVTVEVAGLPPQLRVMGDAFSPLILVPPRLDVGLGRQTRARRVTVRWPSGQVQVAHDVPAGTITLVEPSLLTLTPASRHAPADGASTVTVAVTPRDASGALDPTATVEVVQTWGDATWAGPVAWDGEAWTRTLVAPTTPGTSVVMVTIDGDPVAIAPRIGWDPTH